MTQTDEFIIRLESLKEGERSLLRRLSGRPLGETLEGFDLFTGLWWPLRYRNRFAPRRETSWLITKLYGAFPIHQVRVDMDGHSMTLARLVARARHGDAYAAERFDRRFDALLQSPLPGLEPHLRWALSVATDVVAIRRAAGLDWVQLLDDLSIWDRGKEHRRGIDVREEWACHYLQGLN